MPNNIQMNSFMYCNRKGKLTQIFLSLGFPLVPSGSLCLPPVPSGSLWFPLVPSGSLWFPLLPSAALCHPCPYHMTSMVGAERSCDVTVFSGKNNTQQPAHIMGWADSLLLERGDV